MKFAIVFLIIGIAAINAAPFDIPFFGGISSTVQGLAQKALSVLDISKGISNVKSLKDSAQQDWLDVQDIVQPTISEVNKDLESIVDDVSPMIAEQIKEVIDKLTELSDRTGEIIEETLPKFDQADGIMSSLLNKLDSSS